MDLSIMSLQMCWLSCVIKYYIYLRLSSQRLAGDKKVWETCRTTERSVVSNGQEWTVQPNSFQRC